jgi:lipooligosaccharide transport system permease protein
MWLIVVAGAAEPLFYLLSVGVGIGGLIGTVTGPNGQAVPYREFVAPGLLAVSALNGALGDSTFNVFGRLKFEKLYDAVLATPLGARDVAFAEIGWAVLRGMIYSVTFLRDLVLGLPSPDLAWWAGHLIALGVAGLALAGQRIAKLLLVWQVASCLGR